MYGLNLFLLQSGSPLQARLEVNVFTVILILLALVFLITVIYFLSKTITSYFNSPAYIEKKKNRPTSAKDINEVSTACGLTREEKDILAAICKNHRTPNIKFIVHDSVTMVTLLKEQFKVFDSINDESSKTNLFSFQKKVFKTYRQNGLVKNSKNIAANTIFTLTLDKGFHYKLEMRENTSEALILALPSTIAKNDLPKALEKVILIFELEDGTPYKLESRVVRYQSGKDNENQVVLVHSDKVSPLQKREQERAEMNIACNFHSVKVSVEKQGKKEIIKYTPSEKAHEGILEDISTGGCRLISTLPIKAEQHIYIEGNLNKKDNDHAVGTIVRTTKRSDGIYILHIKFIKIEEKVVNRIQAMVCEYDD
ncbi:MAG: PilZ domain-containing protein [Treponema sp.]|nr:PilZ domain-containing protein [Treponema sp.]